MDLNSLIGKRKYRVRLSPSDLFKNLEKVLCPKEIVPGCKEWRVARKAKRFYSFRVNPLYSFIISKMKIPSTLDERKKLQDEFVNNIDQKYEDFMKTKRSNIPFKLDVIILDVDESGCVCRADCMPFLYERLSKKLINADDVSDFEIQDSHLESLRFLDQVFLGGLGAKPILETPEKSPGPQLVVNNAQQREIRDLVDTLLNKATGEVLICGWVGTYFIPKLAKLASEGVKIRFITHQPSEAKNQPWRSEVNKAFETLCSQIGKENICTDPNMHGRMIIVDDKALIGSMDLNSSSLTGPHAEFAIYTEQPEIVRRLRRIFNSKFKPLKMS